MSRTQLTDFEDTLVPSGEDVQRVGRHLAWRELSLFWRTFFMLALLLLGLWAGRYDLLIALRGEGHEIKLIPIEAPAVATPSAIPQQQSATLPERYRSTDPAAMPWRFQPDGSLEWSDPAQQQRRLP